LKGFNEAGRQRAFYQLCRSNILVVCRCIILFSGMLPAVTRIFSSSFNPVKVLKGTFKKSEASVNPRKSIGGAAIYICHHSYHKHYYCYTGNTICF
jgi:hypothetical protein